MNKVDLQAKVDALMDEINFLKTLYEMVRMFPTRRGPREGEIVSEAGPLWYLGPRKTLPRDRAGPLLGFCGTDNRHEALRGAGEGAGQGRCTFRAEPETGSAVQESLCRRLRACCRGPEK